ncbi:MAG: hypothetical protein LQ342_001587 [Letrouitia transgressa]|nr:MAG: hypothetical protein LQ342_001587 [Letrouitia transgressa]
MAPIKRLLLLSSVATSTFLVKYLPQLSLKSSFVATLLALFSFQLTIWFTWTALLYPKYFSPLRHLPEPKGNSFFNGQFDVIRKEPSGKPQQRWINEIPSNGLIRYRSLFNEERLLITSPKALGEVLVTKNYDFVKPDLMRDGLGRLLGVGILLAEGDEHKIQRKNLMPAFAYRHIKDLYPIFWSKTSEMVKAIISAIHSQESTPSLDITKAPPIEIGEWSSRATLDIIGVAGMGQDFGAIEDPMTELSTTYRKILRPTRQAQMLGLLSLFIPRWMVRRIPVSRNDDMHNAAKTIRKTCRQLIQQKKQKLKAKDKRVDIDIISVALESGGFTEEKLVDQMMTFLAAGHETTATAVTWGIYALCQDTSSQARLREEIRANLPSIDNASTPITDQDLDRLPFLHAVCNEILRLHAPVPITQRQADKNTSICNHFVPKGTRIILSPWAVNHSKELWGSNAHEFRPERWMQQGTAKTGGAESNYASLTFLHGPRSCIGQAFAKAEFEILMAGLVGKFEMVLAEPEKVVEIRGGITARPKDGLKVKMKVLKGW